MSTSGPQAKTDPVNIDTSLPGSRLASRPSPVGTEVTFGVSDAGPIQRVTVYADTETRFQIVAERRINVFSFVPPLVEDPAVWLERHIGALPSFLSTRYKLVQGLRSTGETQLGRLGWDAAGDLWFAAHLPPQEGPITEREAYDRALSETALDEIASDPYLAAKYRDYAGRIWALTPIEGPPTEMVAATLREVFESTLSANHEEALGFDALSARITPAQEVILDNLSRRAAEHPRFAEFSGLQIGIDADDLDLVNDLAHAIMGDVLTKSAQ